MACRWVVYWSLVQNITLQSFLFPLAAWEGRVAAAHVTIQKPKRQIQKTMSFLTQNALSKSNWNWDCIAITTISILELSVEKLLNRSSTPMHHQDKIETALQIYSTANRALFDKMAYRLELDASIRWCSLLMEQNDPYVGWVNVS